MRHQFLRYATLSVYLLQLICGPAAGDPSAPNGIPEITSISTEGDQVVIELSQLLPYDVIPVSSPQRLVVEITGGQYKAQSKSEGSGKLIRRVRGYQYKETPLISRVVVDLNGAVDYKTNADGNQIILNVRKSLAVEEEAPVIKKRVRHSRRRDLLTSLPKEEVTLDFEGADIRDVIRLMAETSNINIIFGPEVAGPISIHLKKVPFDEAFSTILNLKGFVAAQLGSNILRISTPELIQRERAKAIMFTKTIPINYLKADEMQKHIQAVMGSANRKGVITIAYETNSLVVTDTEEGIAQSERLIAQLDKKPRQVMIETRIVEINLNNGFDIGVQWEFSDKNESGNRATVLGQDAETTGGSPRILVPRGGSTVGALPPDSGGVGVSLPGPTAAGISFGLVSNNSILSATLGALITQSRAKVLSAPKVVTVNGQQASIDAVQDIRFRTSSVSNGVVTSDFKTVSAGIKLSVLPTINAEDRITLKINPESSFPTQDSTEAGPIIRTRSAQTTVIVKDGDTLVIGGLIDDQDSKAVTKVPVLGDIPIIGVFFRSNSTKKVRNELLVFVTPRIVRD